MLTWMVLLLILWLGTMKLKYVILAPWIGQSAYHFVTEEECERDWTNLLIFPFLLSRMLHNQLWISFSRYRTAKGNNRIVDKGIEFDQVDRESNWSLIFLTFHIIILFVCLKSVISFYIWNFLKPIIHSQELAILILWSFTFSILMYVKVFDWIYSLKINFFFLKFLI